MLNKDVRFTIIYTDDGMLISKVEYPNWRAIQDAYPYNYKASLGPWSFEGTLDYLLDEYPRSDLIWSEDLESLVQNSEHTIWV